jgi:chromosome segregation ATPase/SAM-dependent methyltransferase
MADQTLSKSELRRSAVYSYLRPIVEGRRVLEVGCCTGETAAHLVRLGARSVIGAGTGQELSDARARHHEGALGFVTMASGSIDAAGVFDLVLVPDAADVLRGHGPIQLSALLALVAPGGRLVCVVANGDRSDGVPYYDVVDALAPHFSKVRMFGQTPFSAYGLAEFDESAVDLRVDAELAERETEEPTHYIALAGPDEPHALGYALVQIPTGEWDSLSTAERPLAGGGNKAPDTVLAEIRQKLAETEGKAEGLLRVSRAQSEEIEELRARLRRTTEARAELDEEVRRLRHALLEADESVVNLTRKTTEEMSALAQRLTAGLRTGEASASPAMAEELRRRESDLAERESALSERDDRIAALEASRQEAVWRADAADDELGRVRAELASLRDERDRALAVAGRADDLLGSLKAQEATIEEFRRGAAAHVDEVNRLRDAANEQASLVTELEDELRATERYLGAANAEVVQLRAALAEVEEADRGRRSRLAELEGLMLRAEHTAAVENETRQRELAELAVLRARGASGPGEADRRRELEAALAAAQAARAADKTRLAELEKQLRETRERDLRLAELRIEAPDPEEVYERLFDLESQYQAATMAAARVPDLEAKLADLEARLAGSGPR